ncbi:hypothetical protein [Pelomonas aquatica]|uniref:hypothetical protein n=1 Tax=Pelomonas aquatica TaxID=431058 RepID=UPI00286BDB44|nr:hypothetical protein [Pelomonas aquatica]
MLGADGIKPLEARMASAAGNQIPFFGMEHARELLEKPEWEFERLREAPNSRFTAFNFFVTAEHLLDWALPDQSRKAREARRDSEAFLLVVSHLCNRAKHLRLGTGHTSGMKAEVNLAPPRAQLPVTHWIYVVRPAKSISARNSLIDRSGEQFAVMTGAAATGAIEQHGRRGRC